MNGQTRSERPWLRELTLRMSGLAACLVVTLLVAHLSPLVASIAGFVSGVWAMVDGLNGR